MRFRVDRDHVGIGCECALRPLFRPPCRELEQRDRSGLRGDVDQAQRGVVGQHVGPRADLERAPDLSRFQVEHQQFVVVLARDQGQPQVGLYQQSVIALRARQVDPGDDPVGRRIDFDQLPARLHVHVDVPGNGIVLRVANLATQRNRRDALIGPDVDHGFGLAGFVRDVQLARLRRVRHSIRVGSARHPGHHGQALFVDRHDLVGTGCACIDTTELRNRQYAVHVPQAADPLDHLSRSGIEDQKLALTQVRNE